MTTTPEKPSVPQEVKQEIEDAWLQRAQVQRYSANNSTRSALYRDREVEYFVGVMTALEAVGFAAPPIWAINIMSGRPVVDVKK